MDIFTELGAAAERLRAALGGAIAADGLPACVQSVDGDALDEIVAAASDIASLGQRVVAVGSGEVARRSTRERGHTGHAQKRGHRSPVSLVQDLTGTTRGEAAKLVRVGESLLDGADAAAAAVGVEADVDVVPVWHDVVDRALLAGVVTAAQHDAITNGLGAPAMGGEAVALDDAGGAETHEAWARAAEQLVDEARVRTVEELAQSARTIRDLLDEAGALRRFEQRFERRSIRTWRDADGARCASVRFDDEGGLWFEAIIAAALRPRRGGPRFVDSEERARAEELEKDPRTNEQLTYDLILDTLRAGALADAEQVFGSRQPGVRVVVVTDTYEGDVREPESVRPVLGAGPGAGGAGSDAAVFETDSNDELAALLTRTLDEGTGQSVPSWVVAKQLCDAGSSTCVVDREGNPLYLGREARLYSPKQRIALALRDGGCRWRGCDRPASFCESHHIDEYVADEGCTDIDRGILLCRWHHMALHNGGWRITREGLGEFMLHPPGGGEPIPLPPRLHLKYAWGSIDPPPRRFRPTPAEPAAA